MSCSRPFRPAPQARAPETVNGVVTAGGTTKYP
jgi:hypothetical protein